MPEEERPTAIIACGLIAMGTKGGCKADYS
jgi:hypothetical protein